MIALASFNTIFIFPGCICKASKELLLTLNCLPSATNIYATLVFPAFFTKRLDMFTLGMTGSLNLLTSPFY